MRTLAETCKCSTQPIYHAFSGAEELKAELRKLAGNKFDEYIENEIKTSAYPEYKAIGMGYIRFAKEEKQLFKFLFMREKNEEFSFESESFEKSTATIMNFNDIMKDEAALLHAEMWIFVHGIAVMYVTGYHNWDEETVGKMLTDVFQGLTAKFKGEGK